MILFTIFVLYSYINYIYTSGESSNNYYLSNENIRIGSPTISFTDHQPFVLQDTEILQDWFFNMGGRGAQPSRGNRSRNVLVSAA